jgi:uncharacterized membrane protein
MRRDDRNADRMVALTLKAGAYVAFSLIVAGLMLQSVTGSLKIATVGLVVLLATPVLRIMVAGIQFLREHDIKYALISAGVLGIVALAYILRVQAL